MIRREIWISLQQTGQCITSMPVSTCIACIGMVSVVSSRVSFCYRVASVVRRRRRLSSSVSRARFVTAEPPDLKLCTCIPLGPNSSQTKIQSDPTFWARHLSPANWWLVGWLVELVGVGWLVGCGCWLVWLIYWLADWLVGRLIDCLIDWLIDSFIHSLIGWLVLLVWLIDWLTDWLIGYCLVDSLIEW